MTRRASTGVALALVCGAALAVLISALGLCGKPPPLGPPAPPRVSVAGTLCERIAEGPAASARGPLPPDPELAAWVTRVESATEEVLALRAIFLSATFESRERPFVVDAHDAACARELAEKLSTHLPAGSHLRADAAHMAGRLLERDGGEVIARRPDPAIRRDGASSATDVMALLRTRTERVAGVPECASAAAFLAPFPDNVRLRRALLLHYVACVEDNYASIDGELDKNEWLFRATVETVPERAGLFFELLVASDESSRPAAERSNVWLRAPFGRITLDVGITGNALRVVRDASRRHPELVRQLLPEAERRAVGPLPPHRRARWVALAAYLRAGAPDPGEPPEPALAQAIARDLQSARWALGFLPNELEEHAPRPYPTLADPGLIQAVLARARRTAPNAPEDDVLLLDVVSRMPPGTAMDWVVKTLGSPSASVSRAALAAIDRQLELRRRPKGGGARPVPDDVRAAKDEEDDVAFFAAYLPSMREALGASVCVRPEALQVLGRAKDAKLDAEVAACLSGRAPLDPSALQALFDVCIRHRDLGWQKTAVALGTHAAGDAGADEQLRRVARSCALGHD